MKDLIRKLTRIITFRDVKSLPLYQRFFLFNYLKKLFDFITDNPHLHFISLIKSYRLLGRVVDDTLGNLYRERNTLWFKNFFPERELYKLVKEDIKRLYPKYKHIRLTITRNGLMIYDNYKRNQFNVLLFTIHSGTWTEKKYLEKMEVSDSIKSAEEDRGTDLIYAPTVLEKGGIWVDNKQSRFICDFNRHFQRAIYDDNSEKWFNKFWKTKLSEADKEKLMKTYKEFYLVLTKLVDTHRFNIVFDGHSMKPLQGRPEMSFGVARVPKFYLPIVKELKSKVELLGYADVRINDPFKGGFILEWLSIKFPDLFIFSMEVNKSLYMKNDRKFYMRKIKKISDDIFKMFEY